MRQRRHTRRSKYGKIFYAGSEGKKMRKLYTCIGCGYPNTLGSNVCNLCKLKGERPTKGKTW